MNRFTFFRRLVAAFLIAGLSFASLGANAFARDGNVRGNVKYEKILDRDPKTGVGGLQLNAPVLRAVAQAHVELVDQTNVVLVSGTTDDNGDYHLAWSGPVAPTARIRVFAKSGNASVVDYYSRSTIYSVETEAMALTEGEVVMDLVARDANRESGPFNILAVIQIGNCLIRQAEPAIQFPDIRIHWTIRPGPETSFFRFGPRDAFILGDRNIDSDEFDDHIILHEYGHFLSRVFSKDDSRGGQHGASKNDPRLAWGEGWATYFACAALNEAYYIDTGINLNDGTDVRIGYDVNLPRFNGERGGYWSERTVSSTLWAIADGRPGSGHLGLGFAEIWKILRSDAWKNRPAYRTLIDFCDALVAAKPELGPGVAKILKARNIDYFPGQTPSTESPYVRPVVSGKEETGSVDSFGKDKFNEFSARKVYSFTLTERSKVTINLEIVASEKPKQADLDMSLFTHRGVLRTRSAAKNGIGGTESIEITLDPGTYFIEVESWGRGPNTGSYRLVATY